MGFFNNFPYTNFHEMNLDWILKSMNEVARKADAAAKGVEKIAEYIKNLEPDNKLGATKVVAIGDSYNAGWTPDGDVTGWGELLGDMLNIGNDFINRAEGAMGFIHKGNAGNTFLSMLVEVAATVDPYNVKTIIVCGGANDLGQSDEALHTAISAFFAYAKKTFVNAKIYVGCIGVIYSSEGPFVDMHRIAESYKKETIGNGGLYVTNSEYCLRWTGYIASDNLHINAMGQRAVADMLYSTINGVTYIPTISAQTAKATSKEFTGNLSWAYNINNNVVSVMQYKPAALAFEPFTGNLNTQKIGTFNFNNPAIRSGGQYGQFNVTGFIYCLEGWIPCDILFIPSVSGSIDLFLTTEKESTYTTLKIPAFSANIFML